MRITNILSSNTSSGGRTMRPVIQITLYVLCFTLGANAQGLMEDFESGPVPELPPGWTVWNAAPFPIYPEAQWTVRDSGQALPGLATATSKSHSGIRAVGISWWAGIDTNSGAYLQANAWLITPRVHINAGDSLVFWATGGTTNYLDSMQVWLGDADSTPQSQVFHMASIIWPIGSTYGLFSRYAYDLSIAAGLDIYIGFRYNQDIAIDGFFVHIDDVSVGVVTSVDPTTPGVPETYRLLQNYPNPFNPMTIIKYQLPEESYVSLKVYDIVGRVVATLADETKRAGYHEVSLNASSLASGVYVYRITAGSYAATKKLVLLK
jgi:hypothetical protein